jgi:hypothetical protein
MVTSHQIKISVNFSIILSRQACQKRICTMYKIVYFFTFFAIMFLFIENILGQSKNLDENEILDSRIFAKTNYSHFFATLLLQNYYVGLG